MKRKVLRLGPFLCLLVLAKVASSREVLLEEEPEYINQAEDLECRMRITDEFNRLGLECQDVLEDVFLAGNYNNNSEHWYFCSLPIMAVILKYKNNLTFCFFQQTAYPLTFNCDTVFYMLSSFLPQNFTCSVVLKYYKSLLATTLLSTTSSLITTTTTPATSTLISSALPETTTAENKYDIIETTKINFIWVLCVAVAVGIACLYVYVIDIRRKNRYGKPQVVLQEASNSYNGTPDGFHLGQFSEMRREPEV